ncbi:hypothetical protein ACHQM5_010852 [Ranunculus cassubicifolius]
MENPKKIRVLPRKLIIPSKESPLPTTLQWLIGSPFTILSTFNCLHFTAPLTPNFTQESDDLQTLLLRGFNIIGALIIGNNNQNCEENARKAIEYTCNLRKLMCREGSGRNLDVIGASDDLISGEIRYFVNSNGDFSKLEGVSDVVYEEFPEKFIWERGCLVRCNLELKLPVYYAVDKQSDSEGAFSSAVDAAISKFRDPNVVFMVEGMNDASGKVPRTSIVRGSELDFTIDVADLKPLENTSNESAKSLLCSDFCSTSNPLSPMATKSAGTIQVSVFFNHCGSSQNTSAPCAEYFPASEHTKLVVLSFKIEVLCYAVKDLPVTSAISGLIVPGLGDQLASLKKAFLPNLLTNDTQLKPFHFCPPGVLHPITAFYELSYGETEAKQVEVRRSLHTRLGLPMDRPLLLVSNALDFSTNTSGAGNDSTRNASSLLKDVHTEIPGSGVSGGLMSRVDGSYEYYHYLQNGFDDSGWGCAYRSLQTIISWFKIQQYTSIEVPSHREIQQALVEIGDKDRSFVGSREWIGAIELSFVLDKLLGVSSKIMTLRSGAEFPEKCRELALHFETQGTPVMIGGGVLAYTLLGVDYNEGSGDCAFLILDPHYTGNEDLRKIVNGGWCGWKKAVDSKGKSFFLHDKFYNLLLPQRPNMV